MWIKKSKNKQNLASVFSYLCVLCVQAYQSFFSIYFSGQCRFIPSCSNYCKESFKQHSPLKAFVLSFLRLAKCNPFYRGSFYDPVPDQPAKGCKI